jgi:serine/threonine-protein kinase
VVAAASAVPIDPPSRPLSSDQQVAESKPLEVRPAAAAQSVQAQSAQPPREAQGAAASAVPVDPPSRPLSSAQQVAELAPLGVAPVPVGVGPPAPEVPTAGPSTTAHDSPTPGTVLPSGQQVAKLEPYSPVAAPPLQGEGPIIPGRIGQIVRYVQQYDGGRCFFVAPVAVTETGARLEGYGASARPFETLDSAFRHENGFEASIDVRLVNPAQCPAVTFLGSLRAGNAPRLDIGAGNLGPGDALTGTVDGFGSQSVALLVATDAGTVQNVSHLLKPATAAKTFTIGRRDIAWASGGQPQLLIVVASPLPLDALRFDRPIAADRLFPAVLGEAARKNQPVAAMARYFKIER